MRLKARKDDRFRDLPLVRRPVRAVKVRYRCAWAVVMDVLDRWLLHW